MKHITAWRTQRQHLATRAAKTDALNVVSDICGLHAQLAASAELSLHARVDDLPADAVTKALWKDRTLIRTWTLRGTLHLVPADELGLWVGAQSALKPRHHTGAWQRHYGLSREEADAMLDAIPQVLSGAQLTREELAVAVEKATGIAGLESKLRDGFGSLLKPAAFRGDLCFAPSEGRTVRFALPADWIGAWEPVDAAAATLEVTRRYLTRYGPATREALARWFGMSSPAQAGRWLKALGDEAVTLDDGATMLAADTDAMRAAEPDGTVRLLPAFDHHVVAAPRDALAEAERARVYRPQGWLSPVVLTGGAIAGVWSHELDGATLNVTVEPFGKVPKRAVQGEADRLAAFLGADQASVSWA